MKVKSNVKSGGWRLSNHNQTVAKAVKVKSTIKAGKLAVNHN